MKYVPKVHVLVARPDGFVEERWLRSNLTVGELCGALGCRRLRLRGRFLSRFTVMGELGHDALLRPSG